MIFRPLNGLRAWQEQGQQCPRRPAIPRKLNRKTVLWADRGPPARWKTHPGPECQRKPGLEGSGAHHRTGNRSAAQEQARARDTDAAGGRLGTAITGEWVSVALTAAIKLILSVGPSETSQDTEKRPARPDPVAAAPAPSRLTSGLRSRSLPWVSPKKGKDPRPP